MRKVINHHRGGVSLKERMLKNSRVWRRLTQKEGGAGQRRAESPDGEGELTHDRQFTIIAGEDEDEQVSRGLYHLASRSAAGTQWTWKKVTVVVGSGAAENVMPRSMFPEISTEEAER